MLPTLRGISHAHSQYSFDGKLPLRDLQTFLTDHGVDFCLMSEHVETLDRAVIERFLEDYAGLPPDRCLMVPGIEIDEMHILLYGVTIAPEYDTVVDLATQLRDAGAFVAISHPVKIRRGLPDCVLPWIEGVEIWNTRYDSRRAPRAVSLRLWRQLRERNPRIVPLAGVDFHSTSDFSDAAIEVHCPRTAGAILERLRRGEHRLMRGAEVFDPQRFTGAAGISSGMANFVYDTSVALNRKLKRHVKIPRGVRRALRKVL